MKPTKGRIIMFIGKDGEDRVAIITKVWNDQCVNLFVIGTDSSEGTQFKTSIIMGNQIGQWQWPII